MVSDLQTQREKIYSALCMTLSERIDQVDWGTFSEDDWARFANMANAEGVAPLIHWTFKHEDISGIDIPTKVKTKLMAAYYNTTAQNQVMFQELERILEALNDADIPVIVLKGAALAATIYPEIGLRPMGDLDLLIPRDEIKSAERTLRDLGYSNAHPELTPWISRIISHHTQLIGGPNRKVTVEMHWSLIAGDDDWRSPPNEWFWAHRKQWENRNSTFVLSPTSNLLFLAAHLVLQHGEGDAYLIWYYDLHLLITHFGDSIEWAEIEKYAREFNWARALHAAINTTRKIFGTPLPAEFLNISSNSSDYREAQLVARKSLPDQTRGVRVLNRMSSMERSSQWRFLLAKTFPTPAYIKWRYYPNPTWTWPIWYPYRWLRALATIPETIKQLRKKPN